MTGWRGRSVSDHLSSLLFVAVLGYLLWQWVPVAWKHYALEGSDGGSFVLQTLDGQSFDPMSRPKPLLLAFWATWCGPCTLELGRIQRLVDQGVVPTSQVLAITSEDDIELVRGTVLERGYTFPVGLDPRFEAAKLYDVSGTPTLVVLNADNKVAWITTGLSPSLELRLRALFQTE